MKVPFVDLYAQYQSIKHEIDNAISSVIRDTAFIGGKYVEEFENNYAQKYGFKYFLGVGNGTDAIFIALKALGIGPGDEVITVCNTWISTAETISLTGATPVFVDIEPDYYNINADLIEEKITDRTKAIIPVHLYGQPANIEKVVEIARKHNLYVIEDCAQAHFATFNDKFVGTFGDIATFSFYPGKNLGAYGDAGGIGTNDEDLYLKMKMFARHGALKKHHHLIEGINSRLDGLQAAILNVKLKYIQDWNRKRYEKAMFYNDLLKDVQEIVTPQVRPNAFHIFHVYEVRAQMRDELMEFLKKNDIAVAIHYPKILPLQPAYSRLNHKPEDFPVGSAYQSQILSLPMYPELTEEHIQYVVQKIKEFYGYNS